ncbi:PhoU domain-containing protein [Streptomyces sp. NPDC051104]|uniref:phosphate signaling complex PhoU family protein n=1 Tax=Streptomyces sp. NPDC051104 TaxID=3155044 RepID=UPI0034451172
MREAYHEELDAIGEGLVEMANLVGSAMGLATTALLDADLHLAESVVSADEKVDDLQRDLENRAIAVLVRQQPVVTDLRTVVTSLRMSADLERCGDLAQHVAKLARMRYPQRAVPRDLRRTILEMGQLAQRLMAQAAEVVITKDVDAALQLEKDDDRMDGRGSASPPRGGRTCAWVRPPPPPVCDPFGGIHSTAFVPDQWGDRPSGQDGGHGSLGVRVCGLSRHGGLPADQERGGTGRCRLS